MPVFTYSAATAQGRTVRGVEEAASPSAVERALGARGLYPLQVSAAASAAERGGGSRRSRWGSRRAGVAESVRYLATLVGAGFPLDRALGTVARVSPRVDVAEAVLDVRDRVRAGAHLADALAEHPRIFPRLAIGMARAGERGGQLAESLVRLADQLEREHALRARVVSAMLYPMVMLVAGAGAVVVLLMFVLPRLVGLLEETGAGLPRSTAALLATAEFIGSWWPALLAILGVIGLVISTYRRSPSGALAIDKLLIALPLVGGLRRQLASVRLGRSLATLLGSGLPVLPALEIAGHALSDHAATEEVLSAREEVRAGGRLATSLGRGRAFPFLFLQMVEVGEDGGRLPEMLERGATAMEQGLERSLDRLVRLAEPVMILLFGSIVGFIALALLRAIYGVHAGAL